MTRQFAGPRPRACEACQGASKNSWTEGCAAPPKKSMMKKSVMLSGSIQKGLNMCCALQLFITGCLANRNFVASATRLSGTGVSLPLMVTRPHGGFSAVLFRQPPDEPPAKAISENVSETELFFMRSWYVASRFGM